LQRQSPSGSPLVRCWTSGAATAVRLEPGIYTVLYSLGSNTSETPEVQHGLCESKQELKAVQLHLSGMLPPRRVLRMHRLSSQHERASGLLLHRRGGADLQSQHQLLRSKQAVDGSKHTPANAQKNGKIQSLTLDFTSFPMGTDPIFPQACRKNHRDVLFDSTILIGEGGS